ncbi:hypothetical protein [Demequina sp.]|uniref:hypothetical protein n=1 Tax=Demequina sp. TaxID=2050685 RepID=UPI003A8BD0E3
MTETFADDQGDLLPGDIIAWLDLRGWSVSQRLGDIAERWTSGHTSVVVPTNRLAPDFDLRWSQMLDSLAGSLATDREGLILRVTESGSDVTEFRATGNIDNSIPLGDAATLIDSVRRAMQASANAALQPRSYYGHSLPDAARDHARKVRMGQTRRGSYIVPVISRLPVLEPDNVDDAVLFEEVSYQPFARKAMLRLAEGLNTLRELSHGGTEPAPRKITEAVGAGVSAELCEAVANTLAAPSIGGLDVDFNWAERLPAPSAPHRVGIESDSIEMIRHIGETLRGEPIVGRQTVVGYVKRLDRGEDDELGRVTLRVIDNDRARNVSLELDDNDYHVAGQANTDRRMVSATGVLHREPGRALHFSETSAFHLLEELSAPSARAE